MKISLIGPVYPYRGGIAHHTAMLASHLARHNHAVQVISFRRQYPGWLYPGASDKDPSQAAIRTPAELILDPLYPWTWEQAAQIIRAYQPELAITQWWTTFWAIPLAYQTARLNRAGIKTAFLIHNVLPHEQRPWDRWLAKLALAKAREFIIQTPAETQRLIKLVPTAKIHLCQIPPYHALMQASLPQAEARRELSLPADEKVFLFFGIVRPYKGLHFLLEAFKALQSIDPNTHLLIAGEFWEDKSNYLKKIEMLGLSERVAIVDQYIPNERLPLIFGAADCLVAPYTGGTQSAVVSTGLAFGLPMIITKQIAAGIPANRLGNIQVIPTQDQHSLIQAMAGIERRRETAPSPKPADHQGWDHLVKTIEKMSLP